MSGEKPSEPSLIEVVLRVQGDLRRALAPISVTHLQAGVLCYLRQHVDARLIDAAAAFRVEPPTCGEGSGTKGVDHKPSLGRGSPCRVFKAQSEGRSVSQKDCTHSPRC
jgi:hypothetical protein